MRQLRKVAVTQHGLPYQHLFSYHPETYKETYCCSAKTGLRWLYAEIQLQITDRAHTDINQAVSNRIVTTCILLNAHLEASSFLFFFPQSTEIKCFCVTEQLTHTHKLNTKQGNRRRKEVSLSKCAMLMLCVQSKLIMSVFVMC